MDPVPGIGEHTDKILAELGLGAPGLGARHSTN
jgi:crotonobetainyl-CoA:carnitine CoA-transferase CaiB-like acyl-CoA transferase